MIRCWFLILGGCGQVFSVCGNGTDCCDADRMCENLYGSELPYCINPGLHTGVCSECARDIHCRAGSHCDIGDDDFGVCLSDDSAEHP